jgi:hypothetical protein
MSEDKDDSSWSTIRRGTAPSAQDSSGAIGLIWVLFEAFKEDHRVYKHVADVAKVYALPAIDSRCYSFHDGNAFLPTMDRSRSTGILRKKALDVERALHDAEPPETP